jgi:hypothetical protein
MIGRKIRMNQLPDERVLRARRVQERDRIRAIPSEEKLRGCGLLSLFLIAIIGGIVAINLTTGVLQEIFDFVTGAAFLLFFPYLLWLIRRYNL